MFELTSPWVLLLWFLPFAVWYLIPRAEAMMPSALKVPFYAFIAQMSASDKAGLSRQSRLILPALIWFLLVAALSGPRWVGPVQPLSREGHNIMLTLDLSGSMNMQDMIFHGRRVSRLQVVKRAAENFVKERSGDKIGLILFGTRAYLLSPLTYDRQSVLKRIDDAAVGLAGQTTSLGDALGLAVKRLLSAPKQGRVVILLTDGANNSGILSPMKAASLARSENIKVYTIGLGADAFAQNGSQIFLNPTIADLDEETLQAIAKETGGRYFRATDPESLQEIYTRINQLETSKQAAAKIRPEIDYYPWLAALALLLFFLWLFQQSLAWDGLKALIEQKKEHVAYDR